MLIPDLSSTTGERKPIFLLSATLSVETTSILGAPLVRFVSQAFRSGSIRSQKPQLGRQKRTSVGLPRKSESLTFLPARSGRAKSGAGSPILRPAGGRGAGAAAWPLLAIVGSVPLSVAVTSARIASAPWATGLPIVPSCRTSTALGV